MDTSARPGRHHRRTERPRYSDVGDRGALAVIDHNQIPHSEWHSLDFSELHRVASALTIRHALDVGSGSGRMLPSLMRHAERVAIVEPDDQRRAEALAVAVAVASKVATAVGGCHSTVADLRQGGVFDFILVSHVLQHLSDRESDKLIGSLRAVAHRTSTLLITAPLSFARRVDLLVDDNGKATRTAREANNDRQKAVGTTLVVHRTILELRDILEAHRFQIRQIRPYRPFSYPVLGEPSATGIDMSVVCGPR